MEILQRGIEWVIDLLFPIWCIVCGREGEWWCPSCIKKTYQPVCFQAESLVSVTALFVYHETAPIGKMVQQYKYHHAHATRSLWDRVVWLPDELTHNVILIPVPLFAKRERERGFNQAHILTEALSKKYHLPIMTNLERIRATKQQAKLKRTERLENMVGAFAWVGDAPVPPVVILVDDVYTTGATMRNCAEILYKNGATAVHGFVLARD